MTFSKPSSKISVSQLQLSFSSVLKLILLVYIGCSLIYTALHFYKARPSPNTLPTLQLETHTSSLQDAKAHADPWNGQTVFWTNVREKEGAEHTFPVNYVVSKVFSGGMMPSKILPYFYKAAPPASTEDITITTLVTEDRLLVLEQMVRRYRGPVSVCMHVSDDEKGTGILNKLHRLMEKPLMKKYVDVHLILDNYERQFNLWRNIARFFARTEFIMMLDVDFFLCTDIRTSILNNPEHVAMLRRNNTAFVVPAFEYSNLEKGLDSNTFPRRKSDMLPQYFTEELVMFHRSWVRGHNATDYEKWTTADQVYEVTDYNYSYEPYVIIRKDGVAWCDERFIGYGSNKAACLYEIYLSGVDFWVLPDDFLIHQTHMYPEEARKQERTYNKKLYQNFREEACYKYSRMLMGTGEWDSPTAHNVLTECSKIPGFQKVVADFV